MEEGKGVLRGRVERKGLFYQHDVFPDAGSELPSAIKWVRIAAALHAPLKAEDSVAELKNESDSRACE